jgi:hypothetical protein
MMNKEEMVKTNEFKELVKQFMIEEAYGACDVELHYRQHGLSFKPRATDNEIESRIEHFTNTISNSKQNFKKEEIEKTTTTEELGSDLLTNLIKLNERAIKESWKMKDVGFEFFKVFAYSNKPI